MQFVLIIWKINMKIAIMLPGYLRSWEYCKQNFMDTVIDPNHQIDIFIDTYDQMFGTTNTDRDEYKLKIKKTDVEIMELFSGLNVVSVYIEPEIVDGTLVQYLQIKKLRNVYNAVVNYEKLNGPYDLYIRSRFDIKLKSILNYDELYTRCSTNPNLIIIPDNKTMNIGYCQNDLFAISSKYGMDKYIFRFDNINEYIESNKPILTFNALHDNLSDLMQNGIIFDNTFQLNLVRVDGNTQNIQEIG